MTEIVAVQNPYLPAMNVQIAIQRRNELVGFVKQIMVDGTDYGKIPGAGDKPTLLKPGAEKLTTFFGLSPSFTLVGSEEDWDGVNHNGEPFFYYRYKCELYRNGNLIAGAEGSCNSHESKYRYRKGERLCPNCEAATIYKSKEPGKGFYCWTKKGGCGATFGEKDARIIGQEVGRVLNPDVADQVNTFQKMSQKRALIAVVLLAVNASEFFTQDIEDMFDIPMAQYSVVEPMQEKKAPEPQKPAPAVQHRQPAHRQPDPVVVTEQAMAGDGMADNPFDVDGLQESAASIVATLHNADECWQWAVGNGYTVNQHSANNRWVTIVKEQFGKYEPAKFKEIAQVYVMHYLVKGKEAVATGK